MKIYQDGNTFYNDATGDVIFVSCIVVTDYDVEAAKKARLEFLAWVDRNDLDMEFV